MTQKVITLAEPWKKFLLRLEIASATGKQLNILTNDYDVANQHFVNVIMLTEVLCGAKIRRLAILANT